MKKTFDIWILLSIVGLSVFSLFNLFGIKSTFFLNQLVFFIIGFIFLLVFYKIGLEFFKLNSQFFYFFSFVLLLITFFVAPEIRGSRRWLNLYFFKYQASEFLKPFFIIYTANLLTEEMPKTFSVFNFKKLFFSFLFFLLPAIIIFKQPDLGNTIVFIAVYLSMLFFAGMAIRYFAYPFLFLFMATPLIWKILAEYQKNRILSFFDPQVDPKGLSYNLIQSIITIGSGGFLGRGLGLGTQSRFSFLPENHTDFVLASLVEQFGFIGGLLVIFLYAVIIFRLIKKIFVYQKDSFIFLFLVGVTMYLIIQIFINIGMNFGIMPIAGISLPFVSYGGSSTVSTMIMLGLTLAL